MLVIILSVFFTLGFFQILPDKYMKTPWARNMETILIVCFALLGLAKKASKNVKDLSFLGTQTTLSGATAVEWCKDGLKVDVSSIIFGTIQKLSDKFDINFEALHLDIEEQVFLILDVNKDRPVLVYQKSAKAQLYHYISELNVAGLIEEIRELEWGTTAADNSEPNIIGQELVFAQINEIIFTRKEGKFGKYEISY